MDLDDKILLVEKNNKDAVLTINNLSDEQNVILYNEFFKKHQFQKNKDLEMLFAGYTKPKKLKLSFYSVCGRALKIYPHTNSRSGTGVE